MSKIPVSVCLIAKNEEKNIERCLKSISGYGFEIIVTDTGSTDKTKEIAKKYADKILDFEWINDFSAARNYCAEHASNDWILSLDCDEEVTDIRVDELLKLMSQFPKRVGMLILNEVILKSTGEKSFVTAEALKFYNKKYYKFREPVHEQISLIDESNKGDALIYFVLPMEVVHYGYAISPDEFRKKAKRDLDILEIALKSKPDDAYIYFQMGQSLFIMDEYDRSAECYKKALKELDSFEYAYSDEIVRSLAKLYLYTKQSDKAVELMEKYKAHFNTACFVYEYAEALYEDNQNEKALSVYIKAADMKDRDTLGAALSGCYEKIVKLAREAGDEKMASVYLEKYYDAVDKADKILGYDKLKMSVCLVAHNDEKNIQKSIESLKELQAKIIVIDVASTDKTVDIASKYADKTVEYKVSESEKSLMEFCIKQADTDWIFILYCDEYAEKIDMRGIRLLTKKYPSYAGKLRQKITVDEVEKIQETIRYFNKEYYSADKNDNIVFNAEDNKNNQINWFLVPVEVVKTQDTTEQNKKIELYEAFVQKYGDNMHIYYRLGYAYAEIKDFEKAVFYLEKGIEAGDNIQNPLVQKMIILLAQCCVFGDCKQEAMEIMEAYQEHINTAEFAYAQANIYIDNNVLTKALLLLIKITAMDDAETLGDDLIHVYEKIVAIYKASGFPQMAVNYEQRLLELYEAKK